MTSNNINAKMFQKAFLAGAYNIDNKKEYINELNVFPVPDGDTGTNMSLTIMAAAKEVAALVDPTIDELAKTISSGSLRGARGNSGVILSQIFRGFCKHIKGKEYLTVNDLAIGFQKGVETAYKAVMKPKEGTILTVAKGVAEMAAKSAKDNDDLQTFAKRVIEYGDEVLSKTPDMLPVLKEAGVVDSGGQGLMEVIKGAYDGIMGKEVEIQPSSASGTVKVSKTSEEISTAHIKFGYCTEFIIMLENEYNDKIENKFKAYLESIGDSLVVVSDDEIVKVHVHTNHPGQAFEKGLEYGSLTNMKVDNMREEHREKVIKEQDKIKEESNNTKEPMKTYGFIAVSVGSGINEILKEIGVDYIIEGGQTMNPSTEDVLDAISKVNAENIFILPNNKNIVLAANQAASIEEEKNIIVIPSSTVPQGISALIAYDVNSSVDENENAMKEALKAVKTGQITYAVRDTSIDGITIKNGDIMGIDDTGIKAVGDKINEVTLSLLDKMIDEDSELISVYYGEEVSSEDANALSLEIENKYPDCDIDMCKGNQPIYYYIVSVE